MLSAAITNKFFYFRIKKRKMAAHFGKLLYLSDTKESDDPYKGEIMVKRLGTMDRPATFLFDVPEDKRALKLEECRFTYSIDVNSNYVPDNSLHAKLFKRLVVALYDRRIFDAFDLNEYTFFNLAKIKLNESDDAQNIELFPMGHFDAHELHASELRDKSRKLVRNGLTIVENRQQYAKKIWKRGETKISLSKAAGAQQHEYEQLIHRYSIRAPVTHGIANQRRVIPAGTKCSLEVELNTNAHFLMEIDEYQTCRIPTISLLSDLAFSYPFHENLKLKDHSFKCDIIALCECAAKKESGEYYKILPLLGDKIDDLEDPSVWDKTGKDANGLATWSAHIAYKKIADIKTDVFEYDENYPNDKDKATSYTEFGWKNQLHPETRPFVDQFMFQSVFVNAGASERPLTTGQKGVASIPFLYPKLKAKPFPVGHQSATITVSSGLLPHMLWISGMPHNQYSSPDFHTCMTKTTMHDPDFKIEEFTIYINHKQAYRSPWKEPIDHYLNFLTMNGRIHNKGLGGGIDFFKFQNENWMVPIIFDDSAGLTGVVDVQITFSKPVEKHWDLLVMKIPIEDCEIDMIRKGLNIWKI